MSRVVCTQPRRIAAISLATRVAQEMGVSLGADDVGYIVRFDNKSSKNTTLKYVTDGILVRQLMTDRYLDSYDVIVIDEVHERRTVTDVLIGLIKQILPYRPDLKVIVMSATLDTNKFIKFFQKDNEHIRCELMEIPGKIYPIEKVFWPLTVTWFCIFYALYTTCTLYFFPLHLTCTLSFPLYLTCTLSFPLYLTCTLPLFPIYLTCFPFFPLHLTYVIFALHLICTLSFPIYLTCIFYALYTTCTLYFFPLHLTCTLSFPLRSTCKLFTQPIPRRGVRLGQPDRHIIPIRP